MMYIHEKSRDDGVSPVVGVMLMLVVTIIIAAVVSAYAGGLGSDAKKAPTASFECRISNSGSWGGSGFDLNVLAMNPAIKSSEIKIVTAWTASDGTKGGVTITGPNVTTPVNTHYTSKGNTMYQAYQSPLGFGAGVSKQGPTSTYYTEQHFGNYSLVAGTRMHNIATSMGGGGYGISPGTRYKYSTNATDATFGYNYDTDMDAMQAILGREWWHLRPGDQVSVKIVHLPTGSVLFDKKIAVEG